MFGLLFFIFVLLPSTKYILTAMDISTQAGTVAYPEGGGGMQKFFRKRLLTSVITKIGLFQLIVLAIQCLLEYLLWVFYPLDSSGRVLKVWPICMAASFCSVFGMCSIMSMVIS